MSADMTKSPSPDRQDGARKLWSEDGSDDLDESGDDDMLVEESGEAFSPQFPSHPNPDDEATARASTPTQTRCGPSVWDSGTEVQSSEHGAVIFLRLGNASDFVNDGRARIQYEKIKRGAKYKKETHFNWVKADTLTRFEDLADATSERDTPRKSPRIAECVTTQGETDALLPAHSGMERDRKLPRKAVAPVRGPNKLQRQTAESKISTDERIKQFPGQSFVNEMGRLKCRACNFFPANKHSSIKTHCSLGTEDNPSRHAVKLQALSMRVELDAELKAGLVEYFESHPDENAGTTDEDQLLYRYRIAESFVASPPFAGIDDHKLLLQRAGFSVPESPNLKRFIPRIELAEDTLLNSELLDQYIGISFDGTTRLGEAINTTGRWCTNNFMLVMRLLDFTTYERHVNNVQLAAHITNLVMQRRGIPLDHVVNLARDSVAVNGAVCRRLKLTFSSAADSLCFCHTLCHVGEHFELPALNLPQASGGAAQNFV